MSVQLIFFSPDTVFKMNRDIDVKHEEDPVPRTEIKAEPQVNYKFYLIVFCVIPS